MSKVEVTISGLEARIIIGVYEVERAIKQRVLLDIDYSYDATKAITNDDFNQAVDYHALETKINDFLLVTEFFLLEKLAAAVLQLVLTDEQIVSATVKVSKPEALDHSEAVSVRVSGQNTRD